MDEILWFWFEELSPEQWFRKDAKLDDEIRRRFGRIHEQASKGELVDWRGTLRGRLAEIIILDQFSRNLYREDARAFAQDSMALVLAQEAIRNEVVESLDVSERAFLYMPFMHSESLKIHEFAAVYFSEEGLESNLEFEKKHVAILKRFGRYPHRNAKLGRKSTPEELEFLTQPGSSF